MRFSDGLIDMIEPEDRDVICDILKNDPRPSYQQDPQRMYTMDYTKYKISFRVDGAELCVCDIKIVDGRCDIYDNVRMR